MNVFCSVCKSQLVQIRRHACATANAVPPKAACSSSGGSDVSLLDVRLAEGRLNLQLQRQVIAGNKMAIVSPSDLDAVMDWYIDRGRWAADMQDRDPYWAVVWPSAIALSELLQREPDLVRGKRVADIGCGLGIAGTQAALAGASEVVLMDREACALQCALLTATASGVHAQSAADFSASQAEADGVRAFEAECSAARGGHASVSAAPFDWNLPYRGEPFDVVIACDVLYETFSVAPLAAVVPSMLGRYARGQRILLTDPPERAPGNRKQFMQLLGEQEAEVVVEVNRVVSPVQDGKATDVLIVVLRRRDGRDTVGVPLSSVL